MAGMHNLGSLKKYLIYLSYVGNEFRGIQKQIVKNAQLGQPTTIPSVQEVLENAVNFVFKPIHDGIVTTSSRTDAGVHAIRTTVNLQLQLHFEARPDFITAGLNKHFTSKNIGIRIQSTHCVPERFSARFHAIQRTYLYRFAFRKKARSVIPEGGVKHTAEIPVSEFGRTYFLQDANLDVNKMRRAADLLVGTKDFFCFMGKPSKQPSDITTHRTIYSLTVTPGQPFMGYHDPNSQLYSYWDVTCEGRAFLYRQVRRIVAVLIAVGRGVMDLEGVRKLLDEPGPNTWDPHAVCAPPWGLYLLDVGYNPIDFADTKEFCDSYGPTEAESRATLALYS